MNKTGNGLILYNDTTKRGTVSKGGNAMLLKNWTLQIDSENSYMNCSARIPANVPGDITDDLYRAGIIQDPYYGMNHNDLTWITRQDFTYTCLFDVDETDFSQEEVLLHLNGVNLFADVYLNGELLGKAENMFLKYTYEVKRLLRKNKNVLQVKFHSTLNAMDQIDCTGYFGVFNTPRIFLRTMQCGFGWDWVPKIPGYGISGEVSIEGVSATRIEDVTYRAHNDGAITFITEVNYDIEPTVDNYGVPIPNTSVPQKDDKLEFSMETAPGSGVYTTKTIELFGKKSFVNFFVDEPQLWWPNGYGEQPMYGYKVVLYRDSKVVSEKTGKFAFREVKLVEQPKDDRLIGFEFFINGIKVMAKGANWIPADCFVGRIAKERYKALLQLAKDGNMNMLRVWGGGLYEHDAFYEYCDEMGIMVFQDFMFACSDLPENDPAWEKNALADCEYQVKRLRNHPCIVYWCGGNEKTGCCIHQVPKGDYFIDYLLTGLVRRLDPTRPFGRQSPCGLAEIGNNYLSGDTHCGSLDASLEDFHITEKTSVANYRKLVARRVISFLSEFNSYGPDSLQTMRKVYPVDKLWPINEYWVDRMTNNPYDGRGGIPFATRMKQHIADLYGESDSIENYIAKGMMFHAELVRAEIEWVRAHQPVTGGVLSWMLNDIWPCGTWSAIDYYLEPKQVYYQMRRSFAPVYASFIENANGETELAVMNETGKLVVLNVEYGCRHLNGETVASRTVEITLKNGMAYRKAVDFVVDEKNTYLYTAVTHNGETVRNVYSPDMWQTAEFNGTYTVKTEQVTPCKANITVKANGFVKGLYLSFPENCGYRFSDNYLDIEDGQEITVTVTAEHPIDLQQLMTTDYAKMAKESSYA